MRSIRASLVMVALVVGPACREPSTERPVVSAPVAPVDGGSAAQAPAHKPPPVGNIPEIVVGGLAPQVASPLAVVITPRGVFVDGRALAEVRAGAFEPTELAAGALPRVVKFVEAMKVPTDTVALLVVDPTTPYRVLFAVASSLGRAHVTRLALQARKQGTVGVVPLALPDARGADPSSMAPLQPVVSVDQTTLRLWSISGRAGTLGAPALRLPLAGLDLAAVSRTLAELVNHEPRERTPGDRRAIAMFDPETPTQTVVAALAALRATDAGEELFPDVLLSVGVR